MKLILSIIFFVLCVNMFAQNAIKYDYDAGGNMTQRYIQVINMRLAQKPQVQDSTLQITIYPNPAKDQIIIEGALENNTKEANVFLYNINGALVKTNTYNGTKQAYSLTGLNTGVYFLEVRYSKEKSSNYKLIITE